MSQLGLAAPRAVHRTVTVTNKIFVKARSPLPILTTAVAILSLDRSFTLLNLVYGPPSVIMGHDKNEDDVHGSSVENLDNYRYTALPSDRHIRLLHIYPIPESNEHKSPTPFHSDNETIHISIEIHSLDNKPEYDALSYTWGDPVKSTETSMWLKRAQNHLLEHAKFAAKTRLYELLSICTMHYLPFVGYPAKVVTKRLEVGIAPTISG